MSKNKFYEKMARGCEVENKNEVLICLRDLNAHIGKKVDGFEGVYGGFGIKKMKREGYIAVRILC